MNSDYNRIEQAIHWIEAHATEQPRLEDLAAELGLSVFHTQRLFKRWAGVSPKQFLQYLTVSFAKQRLDESSSVLETSLDAGLSGPGRLHDHMVSIDAVSPGEYKTKGQDLRLTYGIHKTPFGDCLLALTERGICHLSFDGDPTVLQEEWPNATLHKDQKQTAYFAHKLFKKPSNQKISLHLQGTNFQVKVWEALLNIPSGQVTTYQQVAEWIGNPKAVRAVGRAVGSNPIAWLIPCHRVIRKSGAIHQYRWGSTRKKALLAWESAREPR